MRIATIIIIPPIVGTPTEKKDTTMKGKPLKPSRETSNLPVQALFSYELIGFSSMIKYFCPEY